ncbi:MAG: ABC transporter ATP-binding protein [Alphaproteobacteria bacterium]|nr:ABC transporter ATP-binding protein [Alphaproteobacteria bacterium]
MTHTHGTEASGSLREGTLAPDRAIVARDIVKEFDTEIGRRRVLDRVSFRIGEGERMAILGRNGAGKSTLIQILSGVQTPTSGTVERGMRLSWPLALGGGFEGELTGYDNVRFIARIYGAPVKETFDFVVDFTEIGNQIHIPVRFYSSGMRMRLAFALSLAIDFDCYLIDEVILVGDKKFQEKCIHALFEQRKDRAMILAIHDMNVVRDKCTSALILKSGRGRVFHDIPTAIDTYSTL